MFKFKMQGVMKGNFTKIVREIQFDDGELTGDKVLLFEIECLAKDYKFEAGSIAGIYTPDTDDYTEDAMAVIMLMNELCTDVKLSGNFPKWDKEVEKGVLF